MDEPKKDRGTAEVAVRLSVALKRLRSRLREEAGMTRTGFTLTQLALLQRLVDGGPTTAASLAAAEHVSQQAIAQSVAPLKEAGLVQTAPGVSDRRKVMISVTQSGRDLYVSLLMSREAWLTRAIDTIVSPRERAALETAIELLERLAAADLRPDLEIK
ncbi:MarR family winged helix-turn-helix transcriptional regulator [Rugosimonospora africana]|uniref:MarR family transcriptional regulator n=1 Tax=Rugosimonospora africana TaxID=556532 RepID=A0A8J3VN57_9ACTN|nr:MarR family transcriptional regulator [Rugosimonospora africana]GIH12071.1 MarR family transcriptional regulator [Rugosimonospora africana]